MHAFSINEALEARAHQLYDENQRLGQEIATLLNQRSVWESEARSAKLHADKLRLRLEALETENEALRKYINRYR